MPTESLPTDASPTAAALLAELGRQGASGVLEIAHPGEELSHAWFRDGRIYAMQVPGYRPALGIRLLSGGLVSPEQLSAAAAEQRDRHPTPLIGEVLVRLGFVEQGVIDAFVREQVLDQIADLLDLPIEQASFHAGRRIQQEIIPPADVDDLLEVASQRRALRDDVLATVGGPDVVPVLGTPPTGPAQTPLGPYDWALLCRVDGTRDLTELARICGFTVQEAAQIVADLTLTGLLTVPARPAAREHPLAPVVALHPETTDDPVQPDWELVGTDAGEPEPVGDLLAEFSAFVQDGHEQTEPSTPDGGPAQVAAPLEAGEVLAPGEDLRSLAVRAAQSTLSEPTPPAEVPAESPTTGTTTAADSIDPPAVSLGAPAEERPEAEPSAPQDPPAEASTSPFPVGAPVAPPAQRDYPDTSVFMRELSSLSDDPQSEAPVVTRQVVPLTEQRRKRRFWGR